MEGAWVLPVRMCNRRDAIPPISSYGCQIYSDCVSACVRFFFIILYVINSVHVVLGSDFAI